MNLTIDDKRFLLRAARQSLEAAVAGKKIPPPEAPPGQLSLHAGAFVTLWMGDELRGCIGYIEAAAPISSTIVEVAQKAALEDPRFSPVDESELDRIEIEISVLTPRKRIQSIEEIEIGKHGLIVMRNNRRGLLLPQVPTEYGWDRATFLSQTCRKAGLPADAWQSPETELYTFSALVFREREHIMR